jgi:autotransporter serine protease
MNKTNLKLSVVLISFALAACGGGGGGGGGSGKGGGVSSNSTPTGGGININGGNNGNGTNSSNQPGIISVPMPSQNPALSDSQEMAPDVIESANKFGKNKFGQANKQANKLNLKDAYDQGLNGSGVKVGLVDGAISHINPALPTIVDHGIFGKTDNTLPDHATAIALAIGGSDINGNVLGIAKNVQLHVADASAGDNTISRSAALKAMYDLYNSGVRIINNSYGYNSTYVTDANEYLNAVNDGAKLKSYIGQLKRLTDSGTLMIWAAGNDGSNQPTSDSLLPLAEPELQKGFITVVGVNTDNSINSQSNKCGDAKNWCIAALWKFNTANVHATTSEQMNDYALSTTAGTSLAAPQVTAAAALVAQKYPWMTNDNLRTTILTTATDLGAKGVDSVYGWGLLNIGKAVNGPAQFAFGDFHADVSNGYYVFSNDITGKGGLIKNGNGSLTLSGNNSFLGATNVNAGTLVVTGTSVSATNIGQNGHYAVINGKTASVNNKGTFFSNDAVINGNFTQDATGKLETLVGSVTSVTGEANLNGKLSFIGTKAGYIPQSGSTLDVLNANKITGKFSGTDIDDKLLLDGKTLYTDNSVQLAINRVSAVKAAETLSLLGADNSTIKSGAVALDKAFNKLDAYLLANDVNAKTLSFAEGASKLQTINNGQNLADSLYSLSGAIYSNGAVISSLIQDRLNQNFLNNLDVSSNEIEAIVEYDHINNHWNPSGLSSKQSTNGGLIGAVKKLNDVLTVGGAYAFHKTNLTQGSERYKHDFADIKSNGIMIGAKYQPTEWRGIFLKGSLGYSDFSNNVNRLVYLGNESFKTGTKVDGDLWQIGLLSGKQFTLGNISVLPQFGLRYDYLQQDAFNESGALGYGLHARKLNKGTLSSSFNLVGQYDLSLKNIPFNLVGLIGIEHDFNSRKFATHGGFSGMHLNQIKAGYWNLPKNRWSIGSGVNVRLAKKVNAGVSYRYENSHSSWKNRRIDTSLKIDI